MTEEQRKKIREFNRNQEQQLTDIKDCKECKYFDAQENYYEKLDGTKIELNTYWCDLIDEEIFEPLNGCSDGEMNE